MKTIKIKTIRFLNTDESIGFYWAYICQLIGYDGLEDAYKTMGLAPYGRAIYDMSELLKYKKGFFKLNTTYIRSKYEFVSKHPAEPVYCETLPLFMKNKKIRIRSQEIEQDHKDIACSAQNHLTNILIKFFKYYQEKTDLDNLCFSGGVALNSHFNGTLGMSKIFKNIYLPPFAGDSGLAIGSAQLAYALDKKKKPPPLATPFLGSIMTKNIQKYIESVGINYCNLNLQEIIEALESNKVIALFGIRG